MIEPENITAWIVDDDQSIRWVLQRALDKAGMQTQVFSDAREMLKKFKHQKPSVIITDIRMPGMSGLELLEKIHQEQPNLPVIVITAHSDLDTTVAAYQGGAFEYLPKPFDVHDVVEKTIRAGAQNDAADKPESNALPAIGIIGDSMAMQEVYRVIGRLSNSSIDALINGESGTGKELIAKALHEHSPRADQPFIALNVAAIPAELMESELFGHEKGAFTGAVDRRIGRFEQANGGTLFLDEIGDMPAELQTRLLRVLSENIFYRVGGHEQIKVDVRIIAATHQNLEERVANDEFRDDLFHRLNVIRIKLPPLRERSGDIPALSEHFLKKSAQELNVSPKKINKDALDFMSTLLWPGNVRQLENACHWLTAMSAGQEIRSEDLPNDLRESTADSNLSINWEDQLGNWATRQVSAQKTGILEDAQTRLETVLIKTALAATAGKRNEAAKILGWGRNTLTRKIQSLGLDE